MFFLGKVLGLITQPLVWMVALLVLAVGVQRRRPVTGRRLTAAALVLLLVLGWQPLPDWGLRALESRHAELAPDADLSAFTGVILLGGAMGMGYVAQSHTQPVTNDSGERMSATAALLLRHPQLKVVFSGGEGTLLGAGPNEAQRAAVYFESLGIPRDRIRYESAARTTYENAVLTAQLPGIDKTERWLLLTSAWHIPRSMATFEKAGWNVTAYPVDYRTGSATPWAEYELQAGTEHWQLLLHEWVGILAYRLAGRL